MLAIFGLAVASCKKEDIEPEEQGPFLIFKIKLDPNQERLDNFGEPSILPEDHGAQNPDFKSIALHSIELVPNKFTQFEKGEMVYHADEVEIGNGHAIKFDDLDLVKSGDIIYKIPISKVKTGTYDYLRASVAYQNYNFNFRANGYDLVGTIASFVGHNMYISSYKIKNKTVNLNTNKLQGYFGIEIPAIEPYYAGEVIQGQAPSTTVSNPINATSPIPTGSCTLTGEFPTQFKITGTETKDVIVELSFSINKSFEWKDVAKNNIYEPLDGDEVVDMGVRGLIPSVIE